MPITRALTLSGSLFLTIDAKTGTTYTFALGDANNVLITASNASAQTYSIPTNASVAFPIGTQINIIQIGAGQVTINSTGATATAPKLRARYSAASIICTASNTFLVVGDIA